MGLDRDADFHNRESTARVYGESRRKGRPGWNGVCHWKRSGRNGKIRPGIDGERLYIWLEDLSYVYCILTKKILYAGQGRRGMPGAWDIFFSWSSDSKLRVVTVIFVLCIVGNYVHRPGWTGSAYELYVSHEQTAYEKNYEKLRTQARVNGDCLWCMYFTNKQHNEKTNLLLVL